MTVIVFKDGVMAADSGIFFGDLKSTVARPKIFRAPDGALWGQSGSWANAWVIRQKVMQDGLEGLLADGVKLFHQDDEVAPSFALIAKPDGSLWRLIDIGEPYPVTAPMAIGHEIAAAIALGAMLAGACAIDAVYAAIQHTPWVAGPVVSFRL